MKRISDKMLNKLIDNEGELLPSGGISAMGVLRLALDLRDAHAELSKQTHCDSCGKPLGRVCDKCQRLWES